MWGVGSEQDTVLQTWPDVTNRRLKRDRVDVWSGLHSAWWSAALMTISTKNLQSSEWKRAAAQQTSFFVTQHYEEQIYKTGVSSILISLSVPGVSSVKSVFCCRFRKHLSDKLRKMEYVFYWPDGSLQKRCWSIKPAWKLKSALWNFMKGHSRSRFPGEALPHEQSVKHKTLLSSWRFLSWVGKI